uniref:CDP-L-ribitol pyrophosphorylase A n=1 Tax=Eptatretus burgeri TaxID=7764 RepID=A0A8C4NAB4_EPTBU
MNNWSRSRWGAAGETGRKSPQGGHVGQTALRAGIPDRRLTMDGTPLGVRVSAVLPAGGYGERLRAPKPKQFCSLLGRALFSHTLIVFDSVPWIEEVVVVVTAEHTNEARSILKSSRYTKVTLAQAGSSRHRSILSGLDLLSKRASGPPDIVIIHDAVRPFVETETMMAVVNAAMECGAAGVVRPLVSTVVKVDGEGLLEDSLERSKYRASEMPQAFRFTVIHGAYLKCSEYELDFGTECLHVALKYAGTRSRLLPGSPDLWKVTYKKDLHAAEGLMKDALAKDMCWLCQEDRLCGPAAELKSALGRRFALNEARNSTFMSEQTNIFNFICVQFADQKQDLESAALLNKVLEHKQWRHLPVVLILVLFAHPSLLSELHGAFPCDRSLALSAQEKGVLVYGLLVNSSEISSSQISSKQEPSPDPDTCPLAVTMDRWSA